MGTHKFNFVTHHYLNLKEIKKGRIINSNIRKSFYENEFIPRDNNRTLWSEFLWSEIVKRVQLSDGHFLRTPQYSNDDHPQDALHFTWFPWREMNLCGVYNLCNINYVSCLCIFPAFRSVYFYLTNKSWQLTKKMFQGDLKLCELSFSNRHYITCLYSIYRGWNDKKHILLLFKV